MVSSIALVEPHMTKCNGPVIHACVPILVARPLPKGKGVVELSCKLS